MYTQYILNISNLLQYDFHFTTENGFVSGTTGFQFAKPMVSSLHCCPKLLLGLSAAFGTVDDSLLETLFFFQHLNACNLSVIFPLLALLLPPDLYMLAPLRFQASALFSSIDTLGLANLILCNHLKPSVCSSLHSSATTSLLRSRLVYGN